MKQETDSRELVKEEGKWAGIEHFLAQPYGFMTGLSFALGLLIYRSFKRRQKE